jgi:Mrp family chromosome partitioning ATPase/capsular polysaccharide biosynthesis protein
MFQDDPLSLRGYLRVLREHVVLILLVTLLVGAAAFAFAVREPRRYEASAQVLLTSQDVGAILTNTANPEASGQPDRIAQTQAQLARVPAVLRRTLRAAGVRDLTSDRLLQDSAVTADPTSDLLTFVVKASTSSLAERLATAYAHQFTAYGHALDLAPLTATSQRLTTRLEQLRKAGLAGSSLAVTLRGRLREVSALTELRSPDATVVRDAGAAQQIQPRPFRGLAIGLPVGLVLGVAIALLARVLDTRVRTTSDLERWLRLPLLGRIPRPPRRFRHGLVMRHAPTSPYAEALAALRTNVELANRIDGGAVLMATSVTGDPIEGKSTTVANLAIAFARVGHRVVLVDLDLRQPTLAGLFDVDGTPGLTEVLVGQAGLEDALLPLPLDASVARRWGKSHDPVAPVELGGSLHLLPAGAASVHAPDLVGSPAVGVLLDRIREYADLVLVDTPPLLRASDAVALSARVDALVFVVRIGHERRGTLGEARRILSRVPAAKLGFIAADSRTRAGETFEQDAERAPALSDAVR